MFGSGSHRADLPTRKRTLSKHLDMFVPFEEVKSRRTTPSPFATGVTTPSGSSGYGYNANGDGYFDLTMFVPRSIINNGSHSSFVNAKLENNAYANLSNS